MKSCYYSVFFILVFFGCKKENPISQPELQITIPTIQVSRDSSVVNDTISFNVTEHAELRGKRVSPEYFEWSILLINEEVIYSEFADSAKVSWIPDRSGNFIIRIKIGYEDTSSITATKDIKVSERQFFKFSFVKTRPSSNESSDGRFTLSSDNLNDIKSIAWSKLAGGFSSNDINIINLSPGYYVYTISDTWERQYTDSIFLASYDTIRPLEYFPAYPGSWWLYSNNTKMQCSTDYVKMPLHSGGVKYPGNDYWPLDTIYVVKADGVSVATNIKNNVGVFGYEFLFSPMDYQNTREKFFCKDADCRFYNSGYHEIVYGWTEGNKIVNDTTIIINNIEYPNTQVIERVRLNGTGLINLYLYYFCKDIGIIRCDRLVNIHPEKTYEIVCTLVDYEINKNE